MKKTEPSISDTKKVEVEKEERIKPENKDFKKQQPSFNKQNNFNKDYKNNDRNGFKKNFNNDSKPQFNKKDNFGNNKFENKNNNTRRNSEDRNIDRKIKNIMDVDIPMEKENVRDYGNKVKDKAKQNRQEEQKTKKVNRRGEEGDFDSDKLNNLKKHSQLSNMFQEGEMLDYYDLSTERGRRGSSPLLFLGPSIAI